ncbi:MAG TPA: hypothetical protein VF547_03235 [Allosphingosinicella sp.]|jgi:hypothetical protein
MSLLGNLLGIKANILIGPSPVALPMPAEALQALEELDIRLSDREPSGFRMVLRAGRSGPADFLETPLVADPRFNRGSRLVVSILFDAVPTVIFDGLVSERHVSPGEGSSQGRIVLLGHDLSFEMDREVKNVERPAMDEMTIANLIALSYAQFGIIPMVMPPKVIDPPLPVERTPQQRCSDWDYLNAMARRHGYETYVEAGPVPLTNILYWGPPVRPGAPQRTLTVSSGPVTDAYDIRAANSAEELTTVETQVQDRQTGATMPVKAVTPSQTPLGALPEAAARMGKTRTTPIETSGLTFAQAMARAQGAVDESARRVVRVTGTVDSTRYNGALKARDQIYLRGAGAMFDGLYKVAEVRHRIRPGEYEQGFVLTRGELGAASLAVRS